MNQVLLCACCSLLATAFICRAADEESIAVINMDDFLFPQQFFPELKQKEPGEIFMEGMMSLYPGRILNEAPEAESTNNPRDPVVESLPRGITYLRIYDLNSSAEALDEHLDEPILMIDLRYVSGASPVSLDFGASFDPELSLTKVTESGSVGEAEVSNTGGIIRTAEQPVIVLINHRTRGALEAAIEGLQLNGKIITVGTRTAGATGSYKPIPEIEGFWVIDSEVKATDGANLLGVGLEPEVPVAVSAEEDFTGYQLLEAGYPVESILKVELPSLDPDEDAPEDEEEVMDADPILQRGVEIVIALQVLNKLPSK